MIHYNDFALDKFNRVIIVLSMLITAMDRNEKLSYDKILSKVGGGTRTDITDALDFIEDTLGISLIRKRRVGTCIDKDKWNKGVPRNVEELRVLCDCFLLCGDSDSSITILQMIIRELEVELYIS